MADPEPGLAVVIVTWNVLPLLRECLASLGPQLGARDEVVVVDNASGDGTEYEVRKCYPWVSLVQTGANLGYAAGVNRGIAATSKPYVLVLNPDTRLAMGALPALRRLVERDPSIAVVGPRLMKPDGARESSLRSFPTLTTLFVESTPLKRLPLLSRVVRRYQLEDRSDAHVQAVDWVWGAAFLVRRQALLEAGGLDETYFMYSEEVDLCRRLQALGWAVVFEPAAVVIHHHGASSEQATTGTLIRFNRSKVLYAAKHIGRLRSECLRRYLLATYRWEVAVEAAKLALGHKPQLRRERLRSYRRVLDSGLRRLP
ncbi:MAG: glycosyltransferase family 2 protein [Anaerolineae bacterium]|nr:glycosyltransferase family 2 protein [Anaerolineae bacterium]